MAVADNYTNDEDVELVIAVAEGVLANDTDDGPLTAVLETDVANGTLVLVADGSFTYMPDADFSVKTASPIKPTTASYILR